MIAVILIFTSIFDNNINNCNDTFIILLTSILKFKPRNMTTEHC